MKLGQNQTTQSGGHPDADVLAAFGEGSLSKQERQAVAGHLASCPVCRESLALAFGSEPAEPSLTQARPQRQLSQVWRWGGVAATVCVVALAVEQYRHVRVPSQEIASRPGASVETGKTVDLPALKPSGDIGVAPRIASPHTPLLTQKQPVKSALPTGKNWLFTTAPFAAAKRSAPLPAPVLSTPLASAFPEPTMQKVPIGNISPSKVSGQTEPAQTLDPLSDVKQLDQRGKQPATATQVVATPTPLLEAGMPARSAVSGFVGKSVMPTLLPAPRVTPDLLRGKALKVITPPQLQWSINASPDMLASQKGFVQRSTDGGKSWQTVDIDKAISFQSVAADGSSVWVGGSDGGLFHSIDAGLSWVRVNLSASGSIVRIELPSQSVVKIGTSSRERWVSVDDGQHWTPQ